MCQFLTSGFTDFRFRVDIRTHFSRLFSAFKININSRTTIPVRVTRRVVTILTSQARAPAVVQIHKTPRTTHASGVRPVKSRSRARIPLRGLAPLVCLLRPFTPLFARTAKPRTTNPVRGTRRVVTILTSQARAPAVAQKHKTPRTTHASGARPAKSRFEESRRGSADQFWKQHS